MLLFYVNHFYMACFDFKQIELIISRHHMDIEPVRKILFGVFFFFFIFEPRHEKTNVLHMQKQRRRSASR